MTNESHASYYHTMNTIGIFLYIISVIMWWAGFNYAAARASTTRRRKLFSTAAALALAWPFAFIALAAALATKAAANLMIAVGGHINNTWDAAISDEDDTTIVTKLTPMGTAMRVRRDNTEHDTDTANSGYEDSDTSVATSEETSPALTDDTLLMPPPPPPATNEADGDTTDQADTGSDEATQATEKDTDADDETVTIQKVALSDLL
jgi:Kef-type K+ transport system membrane component KefB